jgi:hypothetical protein
MEWDYVGAPVRDWGKWPVGNGGFSLRSRKFLDAAAALAPAGCNRRVEDYHLCIERREELEQAGMRFAPEEVALRFSCAQWDVAELERGCFGFHSWEMFVDVKRHMESRRLPGRLATCLPSASPGA